jgi:putative flippase GtrA
MRAYKAMIATGLKVARYIISGGTAAVVNLALLYIFVEWLDIWYVLAAVAAFLLAFCVSFTMQKFWTFKDPTKKVHSQAAIYFTVSLANLGINTLLIYIFVDYLHVHYMVGQIIASAILAVSSYFIYSLVIFSPRKSLET